MVEDSSALSRVWNSAYHICRRIAEIFIVRSYNFSLIFCDFVAGILLVKYSIINSLVEGEEWKVSSVNPCSLHDASFSCPIHFPTRKISGL